LALTAASAATPAVSLTFHCDATEATNAIYHLACLAGQIPCTKDKRGFAYMGSRDGHAKVCILAGADAGAIADVVRAFARLQSVSSSGLLLSID